MIVFTTCTFVILDLYMKETKFLNHFMQGNLDSEIREIFACVIWNLENFSLWNPESWESGINLRESEIPLMIGIRNPSSTEKESTIFDCLWLPYMRRYLSCVTGSLYCKAPCKWSQCCWPKAPQCSPTAPTIVGCYMLHPFAHPVACRWELLKAVKLLATCKRMHQLPTILEVICQQCCVCLPGA